MEHYSLGYIYFKKTHWAQKKKNFDQKENTSNNKKMMENHVLVILLCFCVASDHVTCTLNTLTTTEKPPLAVVDNVARLKAAKLNYGGVVPVEISRDLPSKTIFSIIRYYTVHSKWIHQEKRISKAYGSLSLSQ